MSYSGVGRVVPSMVAAKTNASSQNATRRGTAGLLPSAPGDWSRQSAQGWSGMRTGACTAGTSSCLVIVTERSSVMPNLLLARFDYLRRFIVSRSGLLVIVASGHPSPRLTNLARLPLAAIGPDPSWSARRVPGISPQAHEGPGACWRRAPSRVGMAGLFRPVGVQDDVDEVAALEAGHVPV